MKLADNYLYKGPWYKQDCVMSKTNQKEIPDSKRLNFMLQALRLVNRLIIRGKDCKKLLQGVSDALTQSGAYDTAWIMLLDRACNVAPAEEEARLRSVDQADEPAATKKKDARSNSSESMEGSIGPSGLGISIAVQSGLGGSFTEFVEQVRLGSLPPCFGNVLSQGEHLVIEDPFETCPDYPLLRGGRDEGILSVPIEFDGKVHGLLTVSTSASFIVGKEDQDILAEIAADIGFAVHELELDNKRVRVEEELRNDETRLRTLFETAHDSIFIMDKSTFIDCNDATVQIFGCDSKDDILGHSPWEYSPEKQPDGQDSRKKAIAYIQAAIDGTPQRFYWKHSWKNGTEFDAEVSLNALTLNGKTYLQAIVRDISDMVQAQEELKRSEELYRLSFTNATDVIYSMDSEGTLLSVSPSVKRVLGYDPESLVGKKFHELGILDPDYIDDVADNLARVFSGETINAAVFEFIARGGERKIGEVSGAPLWRDGKIAAVVSVARDITERVKAEKIRNKQYNIVRAMATAVDLNELFKIVRNELSDLISTKNFVLALYDEGTGLLYPLFDEDEKDDVPDSWPAARSLTGRVVLSKKSILLNREGIMELLESGEIDAYGTIPEAWLGVPLIADEETVGAIVVQNYDEAETYDGSIVEMFEMLGHSLGNYISRKRIEAERERLSAAIEQAAESVIITDSDGTIEYVNPSFEKITGFSRYEAIGDNPRILKSGEQDEKFYKNLWNIISNGGVWHGHFVNKRKDGTLYSEEATISPVFDSSGEIVHYVAVKRDITRELELEEQYRQAQKMESIGRLAGGVAHDFNNMLSVILGYTELALMKLDPSDELYNDMMEIKKAGQRSADITSQLLAFARKQTIIPKVLDLNENVNNMIKMLRRLIGETIELIWKPGKDLWTVKIDPAQIDQILANLCINARDAIEGNGKIIIETENVSIGQKYCAERPEIFPGSYVMLTVSDNGCGMDEETLTHIFEPFFTTKHQGAGTGLGLATVYGILKQNGGFIEVESRLGKGTSFKIYIPRYLSPDSIQSDNHRTTPCRGKGELILIVEDEESILSLTRTMLEQFGFEVITAKTPVEGLKLAKDYGERIALLVTDVILPGTNGKDLALELRRLFPKIKTLFMSGYTSDVITEEGVIDEGIDFIHKPFTMPDLVSKVCEILQR
ncbi:MAG: hypothetical protein B6D63_01815 [Candidatus Latescibacteria bacterium 4484_7]|nr:MAG: hypothetical protein B6D63_01815 [Candidatus Latescibacteria bacterium 4484_7]